MDYAISDERWERLAPLLPGKPSDLGRTAADNRLFLDSTTVRAHQHAAGARKRGTRRRRPPHARGSAALAAG